MNDVLKPEMPIFLTTSCRTDAGVHAACATAHFDFTPRAESAPFSNPRLIMLALNYSLDTFCEPLRVIDVRRVPLTFHARRLAKSRTYVYRLALGPKDRPVYIKEAPAKRFGIPAKHHFLHMVPLTAFDFRCFGHVSLPIDMDIVKAAATLFTGSHDFVHFCSKPAANEDKLLTTQRSLTVEVQLGREGILDDFLDFRKKNYEYVDIVFKSTGFLYRQVRRLVGTMVAAGKGDITLERVARLTTDPFSTQLRATEVFVAPPSGLYLTNIEYCDEDVNFVKPS